VDNLHRTNIQSTVWWHRGRTCMVSESAPLIRFRYTALYKFAFDLIWFDFDLWLGHSKCFVMPHPQTWRLSSQTLQTHWWLLCLHCRQIWTHLIRQCWHKIDNEHVHTTDNRQTRKALNSGSKMVSYYVPNRSKWLTLNISNRQTKQIAVAS